MGGNQLIALGRKNFVAQSHLQVLLLNNNQLVDLGAGPGTFIGLSALKLLSLNGNRLNRLAGRIFTGLVSLEKLDLSFNSLTELDRDTFHGLERLGDLSLRGNQLSTVPTDSFFHLAEHLSRLDLGLNPLGEPNENEGNHVTHVIQSNGIVTERGVLAESCLVPLAKLRDLYMDHCNLVSMQNGAFDGLLELKLINLAGNLFKSIPTQALEPVATLESIDFSDSPILERIQAFSLKGLTSLRAVRVNNCPKLTEISREAFTDNPSLSHVIIESNPNLLALPAGLFDVQSQTGSLKILNLRNNSLITVSRDLIASPALSQLDISLNSLTCNCSILWLWKLVAVPESVDVTTTETWSSNQKSSKDKDSHHLSINGQDIFCLDPPALRGYSLSYLAHQDMSNCPTNEEQSNNHNVETTMKASYKVNNRTLLTVSAGICAFLVVFTLLFVCYAYRFKLAAKCGNMLGYVVSLLCPCLCDTRVTTTTTIIGAQAARSSALLRMKDNTGRQDGQFYTANPLHYQTTLINGNQNGGSLWKAQFAAAYGLTTGNMSGSRAGNGYGTVMSSGEILFEPPRRQANSHYYYNPGQNFSVNDMNVTAGNNSQYPDMHYSFAGTENSNVEIERNGTLTRLKGLHNSANGPQLARNTQLKQCLITGGSNPNYLQSHHHAHTHSPKHQHHQQQHNPAVSINQLSPNHHHYALPIYEEITNYDHQLMSAAHLSGSPHLANNLSALGSGGGGGGGASGSSASTTLDTSAYSHSTYITSESSTSSGCSVATNNTNLLENPINPITSHSSPNSYLATTSQQQKCNMQTALRNQLAGIVPENL